MQLQAIKEARAGHVAEMRGLLARAESEKRSLTEQESKRFDELKTSIAELEQQEARAAFLQEAERRAMGTPVDRAQAALESRVTLTEAIAAQVENRAPTGALAEFNAEQARHGMTARRGGVLVPTSCFEQRATQTTATSGHSNILPEDYRADQFVGLFRNAMVMRSLGARVLTGLRGDTVIPKAASAATAYWVAEGDALTESAVSFSKATLTPKHVGALSSVSRQLLLQANPSIEQLIRDDFVQVIGLAIDKAMLHGLAANDEPVGILGTTGIETANLATLSWATVMAMLEKLALQNITPNAFITHGKAATKLKTTLKSATAGAQYLLESGRMADLPVHVTNQLDAKAGSPATGRVLLGDFSQIVVGEWGSAEILANPYAATFYERGDIQLRIMATMDMVTRNPKAFCLAEDLAI